MALDKFMERVRESLARGTLIELILGKYRGPEADGRRLIIRPVMIRDQLSLSVVSRFATRDVTQNHPVNDGPELVRKNLGNPYLSAHLFTTNADVQLEFSRKGRGRMRVGAPTRRESLSMEHDRAKRRWIEPGRPFLQLLGVADCRGRVLPAMAHKWKQINRFIEIFEGAFKASALVQKTDLTVADFGSGKGYLTFAIHDYLQHATGKNVSVTGIDIRPDLVAFCADIVRTLNLTGLAFEQGDLNSFSSAGLDVMIALHACDTATDQAIAMGVDKGAEIILCAPCCHKEIRPQLVIPEVLRPVLRHGIHAAQEAEMLTDTLRALALEVRGYDAQVFEFVSVEDTAKNKLILAVRNPAAIRRDQALSQIKALKQFYGISSHALDALILA